LADSGKDLTMTRHRVRCATERLYYHGLKLYFLGRDRYQGLPQPEFLHLSAASAPLNEQLAPQQVEIITPVKLKQAQKHLDAADMLFSRFVSLVRQLVEAFFH
jgi:hypothetical protein